MADSDKKADDVRSEVPKAAEDPVLGLFERPGNTRGGRPNRDLVQVVKAESEGDRSYIDLTLCEEDEVHIRRSSPGEYGRAARVDEVTFNHFEISRIMARNWRRFERAAAYFEFRVMNDGFKALTSAQLRKIDEHFSAQIQKANAEFDAIEKDYRELLGGTAETVYATHPETLKFPISTTLGAQLLEFLKRADEIYTQIDMYQLLSPGTSVLQKCRDRHSRKLRVEHVVQRYITYVISKAAELQDMLNTIRREADRREAIAQEAERLQRKRARDAKLIAKAEAQAQAKAILDKKAEEEAARAAHAPAETEVSRPAEGEPAPVKDAPASDASSDAKTGA